MSAVARKLVLGIALLLLAGTAIGWIYNAPVVGLLVAALLCLLWQLRQLLRFDHSMRLNKLGDTGYGDGVWEQISSRFQFERRRSQRRKARYRSLLKEIRKSTDALPDGAVILDSHYEIVSCNRAARALVGLKNKTDRGRRIDNILRDPKVTQLMDAGNFAESIDIASPLVDGHWLNCRVVPYGADQKLLLLRDVTERLRLGRMRRDFVANASHELRSPLTVISGYLDSMVDDDELSDAWTMPVRQMRVQARRMNRLLGEMLELSRLESAGSAEAEPIDVISLLERIGGEYAGRVGTAPVTIRNESAASLLGVESEIESVVSNLLTNALRFTPADGEITVIWRDADKAVELVVQDTGDGIDPGLVPRLTERFFRIDRGRDSDKGGVGLGLAIVKHVLARHDSELIITSVPEQGSEFCCRFPAERVAHASPPNS